MLPAGGPVQVAHSSVETGFGWQSSHPEGRLRHSPATQAFMCKDRQWRSIWNRKCLCDKRDNAKAKSWAGVTDRNCLGIKPMA